jgi:predicted Zn-dependent peptidase
VVLHGASYRGRLVSPAALKATDLASLKAWHKDNIKPSGAVALVGGDATLAEVMPLLEERFGRWKGTAKASSPALAAVPAAPAHVHVVDKPGAPQAVLRAVAFVAPPTDAAWFPQVLANQAFGGQFTSRLNLNLREEKGWTYGARSSVSYDLRGGAFTASAGVVSAHAVDSLVELRKELDELRASRPVGAEEFRRGRDALALGFPLRFENPGYLLSQEENAWRYGLGADWVDSYLPKLNAVSVEQAQAAWVAQVDPALVQYVMVGDLASMRPGLDALGMPWSVRDVDGNLGSR